LNLSFVKLDLIYRRHLLRSLSDLDFITCYLIDIDNVQTDT